MELNTNIKTGCLIFTENKNKVMKERNVKMYPCLNILSSSNIFITL